MRAVILWELKRRRFFVLWWTLGIASLIAVTALAYKAIGSDAKQLNSTFDSISSSAGGFFGGSDFFSPIGYMSSQIYYILLPILVIVMTLVLASGLMNRDENDGTVEYTLARPISRRQLLCAKAIVGLTVAVAVCALTYFVTFATVHIAGIKIDQANLLMTHLLSFTFSASFGVIAFALMAFSQLTRKAATSVAIVLAFGGYVISSLAGLVHWLEAPAKFMPYHYYDTVGLLGGHIERGLTIYLVGVIVIPAAVAMIGYSQRDIGE
ncbi:MAG TPA: ABC transporter permease subunit [Candidatus Saccharimonadales bacterium]|nr:ABC transporter permease subunit [Candidatus Saccharimonadales bacterium]